MFVIESVLRWFDVFHENASNWCFFADTNNFHVFWVTEAEYRDNFFFSLLFWDMWMAKEVANGHRKSSVRTSWNAMKTTNSIFNNSKF